MQTLDELTEFIKTGIENIGEDFTTPDNDWLPVMFVQDAKQVNVIPLPLNMFETGTSKSLLAVLLKKLIKELGGIRYGLLLNVHGLNVDKNSESDMAIMEAHRERGLPISAVPGSYEMLYLTIGDAEQETVWTNKIDYDGESPRKLTEWKELEYTQLEGRFVDMGEELRRVDAVTDS